MILVIGGVTLDRLHFAGEMPNAGETATAAGGAGMYTALAARRAGGNVTLFAPRPDPLPERLSPIAAALPWLGPRIPPGELPRLEIVHYGRGRAALRRAFWGAQARMTPSMLPDDLSQFDLVHIAALGTAQRQLDFARACRARGAGRISAGTYAKVVFGETENVRALFAQSDLFFLNENEANGLFGGAENAPDPGPGRWLFVTLGARGALVIGNQARVRVPAPAVAERDPTGAGDTFCGAVLAGLDRGLEAVSAARQGVKLAAGMIQYVGPGGLLGDKG